MADEAHPFLVVAGLYLADRPYLDFIATDTVQEFRRELNRYLRNPAVAGEVDRDRPDYDYDDYD